MKTILATLGLSLFLLTSAKAQFIQIPDPIFKTYLQQTFPTCFNGSGMMDTTCNELFWADTVDVSNMGISDLTGVQYIFGNVLNCSGNQLTWIPHLDYFSRVNCSNNQLQQLDISSCPSLNCSNNQITVFNITGVA